MSLADIVEKWDGVLFTAYNFCAVIKYFLSLPKLKSILKKNKNLKDNHSGERCFVIMNGPSILDHDLRRLENEVVFSANYFYRSDIAKVVKPNYHCWLDSKLFSSAEGEKVQEEILGLDPSIILIENYKGYNKRLSDRCYYTYNKHLPNLAGIRSNLSSICSSFSTVALYAINAAIYMGFKNIYVMGLDFPPGAFKHFDNKLGETTDPKKQNNKSDVCSNYWSYTKAHYEAYALDKYAKRRGVHIVNLNPDSCIRAFDFDLFERVIEENK